MAPRATEIQDQNNLYALNNPKEIRKHSKRKRNRKMMNVREESNDLSNIKAIYNAYAVENQKEAKPSLEACLPICQNIGKNGKERVSMSAVIGEFIIKACLIYLAKDWLEALSARYSRYRSTPFFSMFHRT